MDEIIFVKYHLKNAGGLEKHTKKIIDFFLKKQKKITLLTSDKANNINTKDLTIKTFKQKKSLKFLKLLSFDKKCRTYVEDNKSQKIVFSLDRCTFHTHTRLGNGVHLKYLENKKLYESKFKTFLNKINPLQLAIKSIEKRSFQTNSLKKIFVNSNMVKDEVIKYYNVDESKISVIHNGVEFYEMQKDFDKWKEDKEIFSKDLNLDKDDFHFLFIGNDYRRKGLKNLIRSLFLMKSEKFHLSVIGKESKIDRYIKLVKELGMEKKITFFKERQDTTKFYQLADCLIIPSFYDPFANVTIEALSMGVFVISSKYNGGKEVLSDETGYILENLNDENEFKNILEKTLSRKKTTSSAKKIRKTVEKLDFKNQLNILVEETLKDL